MAGTKRTAETPRRLSSEARRQQIVNVTVRLIARYGVQGASMARIAKATGVTKPALYAHFANRKELLLAALDSVFDKAMEATKSSSNPNAPSRLAETFQYESTRVSTDREGFVSPLFEFVAAPPSEGLRDAVIAKQLAAVEALRQIVEEGKQRGTVLAGVDSEQVAWEFVGMAWTLDMASRMGVAEFWNRERIARMRGLIVDSISSGTAQPIG